MESRLSCYDGRPDRRLAGKGLPRGVHPADTSSQEAALEEVPAHCLGKADRLLEQGIEQQKAHQFEAALQSFQEALNLYTELQDRQGIGRVISGLGLTAYMLGDFPTAIEHASRSLAIAREIQDQRLEAQVLGIIGNAYRHLGDHANAIAE